MKLTKSLMSKDDKTKIVVSISIESHDLTRDEAKIQINGLTSKIMEDIPCAPYFGGSLCQIKVK